MKDHIINNLENPHKLEQLYRNNKTLFVRDFMSIFPEIADRPAAQVWNERLNFEADEISWGTGNDLMFVVAASFIAGLIAKMPHFLGIDEEYFYSRNIAFIVFPMLIIYFAWKHCADSKRIVTAAAAVLISIAYVNFLPDNRESDTLVLACMHLPLFIWAILGYTFAGYREGVQKRLEFLRYNGDLAVMMAVILIACGLLTAITLGLFDLINIRLEKFYFDYIGIWGLAAIPIVATYLVRTNPQLVSKVSPVIAKVFTPLVFIMLSIYLIAVLYSGKDPYNDRDFLLIFNLLLMGVMALILFSVAETSKSSSNKFNVILLFCLSMVTIIVNGIALSAIVFRISEWGITPNRLAVIGSNLLILINLSIVAYKLFNAIKSADQMQKVEQSIATYLPVYVVWTLIVTFVFPVLFRFA